MLVKKFEARTMKEALELVKKQLGPDAVILSVKDHRKRFGLGGEGSVEITAAVSENSMRKKEFAEAKIRESDKDRFRSSSVKVQKDFIEKAVTLHRQQHDSRPPITQRRYADIEDEMPEASPLQRGESAESRIRSAALRAKAFFEDPKDVPMAPPRKSAAPNSAAKAKHLPPMALAEKDFVNDGPRDFRTPTFQRTHPVAAAAHQELPAQSEFLNLRSEITELKKILSEVQTSAQVLRTFPGSEFGLPFDLSRMFTKLKATGLMDDLIINLLTRAKDEIPSLKMRKTAIVEGWVAMHLMETILTTAKIPDAKVQMFIGQKGTGKTSQLIKMAAQKLVQEKKKILILTCDTLKIGAAEQMKTYAQILNAPFQMIRMSSDWEVIRKIADKVDHIFFDTPGLNPRNPNEIQWLRSLMPPNELSQQRHFVTPVALKDADILETLRKLSDLQIDDLIFTALDEAVQHGTIYNVMEKSQIPLHSFGIGPRVPEDFEYASKERVLDLILKITQAKEKESVAL